MNNAVNNRRLKMNEHPPRHLKVVVEGLVCCKGCTLIGHELKFASTTEFFTCLYLRKYIELRQRLRRQAKEKNKRLYD